MVFKNLCIHVLLIKVASALEGLKEMYTNVYRLPSFFFLCAGGIQGLEEEYHRAIANNIVQELLFKKRQRQKEAEENRAKEEKSQTKRTQQRSASKEKVRTSSHCINPYTANGLFCQYKIMQKS